MQPPPQTPQHLPHNQSQLHAQLQMQQQQQQQQQQLLQLQQLQQLHYQSQGLQLQPLQQQQQHLMPPLPPRPDPVHSPPTADNYPVRRSMDSLQSQHEQRILMMQTHQQQQQELQSNSSGSGSKRPKKKHFLHKTELCRTWRMYGTCPYGTKCQFAHSESELRVVTRHPKWKTALCKRYWMTGSCPYGDLCSFIHRLEESAIFRQGPEDIPPLPQSRQHLLEQQQNQPPLDPSWQAQMLATSPAQLAWQMSQAAAAANRKDENEEYLYGDGYHIDADEQNFSREMPLETAMSSSMSSYAPLVRVTGEPSPDSQGVKAPGSSLSLPRSSRRESTPLSQLQSGEQSFMSDAMPMPAPRRSFTLDSDFLASAESLLSTSGDGASTRGPGIVSRSNSMSSGLLAPFRSPVPSPRIASPGTAASFSSSVPASPLLPVSPPNTPLAVSPDTGSSASRFFSNDASSTSSSTTFASSSGRAPLPPQAQQPLAAPAASGTSPFSKGRPTIARGSHARSHSFHVLGSLSNGKYAGFSNYPGTGSGSSLSSSPPPSSSSGSASSSFFGPTGASTSPVMPAGQASSSAAAPAPALHSQDQPQQPSQPPGHSRSFSVSSTGSSTTGSTGWDPEQEILLRHLRSLKISPSF